MPAPGQTTKPLVKLPRDPAGCWLWLGATSGEYPVKEYCGQTMPAARWLWLMLFGPLDPGLVVSQTCQNRLCLNPAHLVATSIAEINRETHSALVPADVIDIRERLDNGYPADLRRGAFDPTYRWQLVGHIECTGREWVDYVSYCADFPEGQQLFIDRLTKADCADEIGRLQARRAEFLALVDETLNTIKEAA